MLALAHADGGAVRAVRTDDPQLVEGVNDRAQLAVLRAELNRRLLDAWMRAGVTVVDPATTWVDVDVELAPDVTLLPGRPAARAHHRSRRRHGRPGHHAHRRAGRRGCDASSAPTARAR